MPSLELFFIRSATEKEYLSGQISICQNRIGITGITLQTRINAIYSSKNRASFLYKKESEKKKEKNEL